MLSRVGRGDRNRVTTLWLVNGQSTGVDPSDRGLAYGDGLFETMAAADGRIRWLDLHLSRLTDGCARLGIPTPSLELVRREIAEHCPRTGRAVAKLIVTRGSGARGYRPPAHPEPTRILAISAWPNYPATNYTRGIELQTLKLRLGQNPRLAGLKHLSRLEQVLAQAELRDTVADEGLLLDTDGWVVGGTSSNVFAVRGRSLQPRRSRAAGCGA